MVKKSKLAKSLKKIHGQIKKHRVLVVLGLILIVAADWYIVYSNQVYPLDQAQSFLWTATDSSDLSRQVYYMTQAQDLLEPYSGNPKWSFLFPTSDTDFDVIKDVLNQNIVKAGEVTPGGMAEQQMVSNLQTALPEVISHIELTKDWLYWTPTRTPLIIVAVILFFVAATDLARSKTGTVLTLAMVGSKAFKKRGRGR